MPSASWQFSGACACGSSLRPGLHKVAIPSSGCRGQDADPCPPHRAQFGQARSVTAGRRENHSLPPSGALAFHTACHQEASGWTITLAPTRRNVASFTSANWNFDPSVAGKLTVLGFGPLPLSKPSRKPGVPLAGSRFNDTRPKRVGDSVIRCGIPCASTSLRADFDFPSPPGQGDSTTAASFGRLPLGLSLHPSRESDNGLPRG